MVSLKMYNEVLCLLKSLSYFLFVSIKLRSISNKQKLMNGWSTLNIQLFLNMNRNLYCQREKVQLKE